MNTPTKTIGVIGGMGPAATADFFRRIVDSTLATKDQDHLHVIIDSQPQVPDRTAYILSGGADPAPTLIATARTLETAGADLLVMACNTAHAVANRIAEAVSIQLVNWIEEAAEGLKHRLPGVRTVGILATDGTIASDLYQCAFAARGIDVVLPGTEKQEQVMAAIYGSMGVKSGPSDLDPARTWVRGAGRALFDADAEGILLACTELSVLFDKQTANWGIPVFDAAQIVAERVIELAGGTVCNAVAATSRGDQHSDHRTTTSWL